MRRVPILLSALLLATGCLAGSDDDGRGDGGSTSDAGGGDGGGSNDGGGGTDGGGTPDGGTGLSATQACQRGIDSACDKAYECTDTTGQQDPNFQAIYGTSVTDCKTHLAGLAECATATFDDFCTAPEVYDLTQLGPCEREVVAQSCVAYTAGDSPGPACDALCAASP